MAEEKRVPQYRLILQALEERIRTGAFSFDEPLCTESTLMAEFGSSRITVRRALEELENKGFITRKRGIGCFVSRKACESLRAGTAEAPLPAEKAPVYALVCPDSLPKAALQSLFDGACEALAQHEAHVVIYLTGDAANEQPDSLLMRLASMDIAGAAVMHEPHASLLHAYNHLLLQGKAVVTVGDFPALPHIRHVQRDLIGAASALTGHLTALGHTRIAVFADELPGGEMAKAACMLAFAQRGLPLERSLMHRPDDGEALRQCIASGATAIIVQSEAQLHRIARDCTAIGLHAPGMISLCCMEPCAPLPALRRGERERTVTCLQYDYAAMGRACAKALWAQRTAPVSPTENTMLCAAVAVGTTTAAPAGHRARSSE